MIRIALLALLVNNLGAPIRAQAPRPSVIVAQATPKAIGEAMRNVLQPQNFRLWRADKNRIVLVQPRGNVAQTTGEIVAVRLEVGFTVEQVPNGHRITLADETLIGERSIGAEQHRPQDLERNRQSYRNLLNQVKAAFEPSSAADSAGVPR